MKNIYMYILQFSYCWFWQVHNTYHPIMNLKESLLCHYNQIWSIDWSFTKDSIVI